MHGINIKIYCIFYAVFYILLPLKVIHIQIIHHDMKQCHCSGSL